MEKEARFRTPAILADHGVTRAINVIIQGDAGRYGILEVDSSNEDRFSEDDLAFMNGFANLIGVAVERQHVEEDLRASEARLQEAMDYQRLLTHEISHRVKNSLSLVAGLLRMQRGTASEPDLRRALDDACARVTTIAQVHDRLWRADEVDKINLAEFMGELCDQLRASATSGQTLSCEFAPVMMATDQAVPLALLVNELVTNAFKYAYPVGGGNVWISIQPIGKEHLQLTISDRGRGLPPDFDAAGSKGLGMKLIHSLGRQLGGRPQWQNTEPGTRFVLEFLVQEHTSPQV